ncbi:MAG: hypothetical protein JNN30_16335 [Rhodanobacteraceae bacterium]|nr:hypothetical protein [Rhodanobacteraceae bacterium]
MKARCTAGLLVLTALLAGCAPSEPVAPQSAANAGQDDPSRGGRRRGSWIRAESEHNDLPIAWEVRDDYRAPPGAQRRLLIVSQAREVPYLGQVDAAARTELSTREQRLLDTLGGRAELIAVLDWRQQHDWYFSADERVQREHVLDALGDAAVHDIRVDIEADDGLFYRTLLQRVGVAGKP